MDVAHTAVTRTETLNIVEESSALLASDQLLQLEEIIAVHRQIQNLK